MSIPSTFLARKALLFAPSALPATAGQPVTKGQWPAYGALKISVLCLDNGSGCKRDLAENPNVTNRTGARWQI